MKYKFGEGDLILFDSSCPVQGIFRIKTIDMAGIQIETILPVPGSLPALQFLNPYEVADLIFLKRAWILETRGGQQ